MPLPHGLAEFNRAVTNHLSRPVAARLPGFGVVHHTGRRSGRRYATPVNVFARDGGFVIALTYGSRVDWVRNVLAAGGCDLEHRARTLPLTDPRLIEEDDGMAAMPAVVGVMLRALAVTEFLELAVVGGTAAEPG